MKFSCERCGKKYATAETPAPGRVYKIKCKACGQLIVVKASAGALATAATEMRPPTSTGILSAEAPPRQHPAATPDIHLEVGAPEAADPGPGNGGYPNAHQPGADSTQEISMSGITAATPEEFRPPPADAGYVDLFAEAPKQEPPQPQDDPFLAAARASLPENYGSGTPATDPFAPLREELSTPPPPERSRPAAGHAPTTTPKIPVIPKPAKQQSALPIVLIGAGALVLVGILTFVLLGGKSSAPPAPPPPVLAQAPVPVPQAQPPAAPIAPQPLPAAAPPAPVGSAPEKREKTEKRAPDKRASDDDRHTREDRREREREAKEARDREAREAKERERLARDQRARDERESRERERQRRESEKVAAANLPEPESGLRQEEIQKVLSSTRKAFENCIVTSGKLGEVKLDGRRVMLRLNIQTSGAVTYPTLDDVTLNGTELGSCLKSAARLMVFPKFRGDNMHVEVPLVLAGR